MANQQILAIDLGASNGRGVLVSFDGKRFELEEVHRFDNGPVRLIDTLHWDVLGLYREIKASIRAAVSRAGQPPASVGIDTWGVDFGLLGVKDRLLANPFHYRDARTNDILEKAFAIVSREHIFDRTGLQFMQFNTLFQLLAFRLEGSDVLDRARTLLMMPGLFNFWLTGRKAAEFTAATTTQFYDPRSKDWARDLLEDFELPTAILPEIVDSGTRLGTLLPEIGQETGAGPVPVIAGACHDTGAAVASVPARGENWAFISSGTWSLMGMELGEPILTDKAMAYNFTNEGGVAGTIRFLKNIMGLWLIQEARRIWQLAGESYSWAKLTAMAEAAPPFATLVDPDHDAFMGPGDLPARMAEVCEQAGQKLSADKGAVLRCALESLALKYRYVLECLEDTTGRRADVIHVVGGGSRNTLLCQFTADATGREVLAGPVEATALGNAMMQAIGLGLIDSVAQGREVIRHSFDLLRYEPKNPGAWDEPYARFRRLLGVSA